MIALMKVYKVERALSFLAAALLLLFLLIYLHPYHGIRHDAILYLGQSLLRWRPEQFGQDLFFAFGSQAQFTLFPQILAWFLSQGGGCRPFQVGHSRCSDCFRCKLCLSAWAVAAHWLPFFWPRVTHHPSCQLWRMECVFLRGAVFYRAFAGGAVGVARYGGVA